ncbi:MAG: hypothetical protein STSR0008_22140 [Ignavibacterium sp.]
MKPRTKEEFDNWYIESNGDPWDYKSKSVQSRILKSLKFIAKYIPISFEGNIIELGSFKGDFTILLAQNFKHSKIYANDISEFALNESKKRTSKFTNIYFIQSDLKNFNNSKIGNNANETILLLLECIYYLKNEERFEAIKNLNDNFPYAPIFLSAPIIGKDYFTEDELINLFKKLNYKLISFEVLNLSRFSFLRIMMLPFINKSKILRKIFANQTIFYFQPERISE